MSLLKMIQPKKILSVFTCFALFVVMIYGVAYHSVSRPIDDPAVQSFYRLASSDGMLPSELNQRLLPLVEDGISTLDLLDFEGAINVYCGNDPLTHLDRHLLILNIGLLESFSFGIASLHNILVLTDGKPMVDQLDRTLCKK